MSEEVARRSPLTAQLLLLIAFFVIAGIGIATVVVPALTQDAEQTPTEATGAAPSDVQVPPDEPEE